MTESSPGQGEEGGVLQGIFFLMEKMDYINKRTCKCISVFCRRPDSFFVCCLDKGGSACYNYVNETKIKGKYSEIL